MKFFTNRARGVLSALMLALCLVVVAGCGGDDKKKDTPAADTTAAETTSTEAEAAPAPEEEDPAPNDFVAQANALCDEAKVEIQALGEAGDVPGLVGRSDQLTNDIAALEPPAEQQEQFDALVSAARANDDEARRIVEDGGTIDDLAALDNPEADALAAELGLTSCA
jgi:hypothetical protein